jgi:hypothetical protein
MMYHVLVTDTCELWFHEGQEMAKKTSAASVIIPAERIQRCIYLIRGRKVLLDEDLAGLYGVETRVLNQAVSRNMERFPADFMFRLSATEFTDLKSQFVTSSWGGRRKAPRAFTEQGVAMLSSVLRSARAVSVNIAIMRAFVQLRETLADNAALRRKIEQHDEQIKQLFVILHRMLEGPKEPQRPFGFHGRKKS